MLRSNRRRLKMAQKKNTTKKVKYPPVSDEDHLLCLIKFSERAITKQGTDVDKFFEQQAFKFKKQLEKLK